MSLEETFWATTQITFLGFLIDTIEQLTCVPREKITRALNLIKYVINKPNKKITVLQLQRICGFLNFIGRAIVPGRAFTRHLYAHLQDNNLRPYHHIHVTQEMRLDLTMWEKFLIHPAAFARPFMDFSKVYVAEDIDFYSDAAKNPELGFGAKCGLAWMAQKWDSKFIIEEDPSIAYLELYAVVAVVLAWVGRFSNKRIQIYCDNQSVCYMINQTSSKCKNCMVLICILVLKCLVHNVRIYAKYITSKNNIIADNLSRRRFSDFEKLRKALGMNRQLTEVPDEIWPLQKIWVQ